MPRRSAARASGHRRVPMESILPILIMLVVFLALNKTQTGSFF